MPHVRRRSEPRRNRRVVRPAVPFAELTSPSHRSVRSVWLSASAPRRFVDRLQGAGRPFRLARMPRESEITGWTEIKPDTTTGTPEWTIACRRHWRRSCGLEIGLGKAKSARLLAEGYDLTTGLVHLAPAADCLLRSFRFGGRICKNARPISKIHARICRKSALNL